MWSAVVVDEEWRWMEVMHRGVVRGATKADGAKANAQSDVDVHKHVKRKRYDNIVVSTVSQS